MSKLDAHRSLLAGRYTYAVDLYSYGVMLYMLVSGGETSVRNPACIPQLLLTSHLDFLFMTSLANKSCETSLFSV